MDYFNFLIPKVLEEITSKINGIVKVINFGNKPRIVVNNLIQSGGMVEVIWKKGIEKIIKLSNYQIENCLILGLGGGSVARLVNERFPKAKIVGVEIDPVMIGLGKKYFDLDKIENLKVVNKDALNIATGIQHPASGYNLILVDMYIGSDFPKQAESLKFLKDLKKLLSSNGVVIFNRLFYGKYKKSTEEFIHRLDKIFSEINLMRAFSNLLVFCKNK